MAMPPTTARHGRPTSTMPLRARRGQPRGGTSRVQRGGRSGSTQRDGNPYATPMHLRRRDGGRSRGLAGMLGALSIGAFVVYLLTVAAIVGIAARGDFAALTRNATFFVVGIAMIFVGLAFGIAGALARGPKVLPIIGLLLNGLPFVLSVIGKLSRGG